ncbi:MAG TPA: adenylate/guanylate cyclase domain-containing protein [Verrucomicrobiae bacterium]
MQCWLENETGGQIPLQGTCTIGRSVENVLAINDAKVSRRHAIIHAQGGEFYLVDLGSRNGTLLNGQRLRIPSQLKDNDVIRICTTSLKFRAIVPAMAADDDTDMETRTSGYTGKTSPCWLLVADIRQFTKMSQIMPQDELAQLVGKWVMASKQTIEATQGLINKYLGDGYLAFWPMESTQPESIANTIQALKAMQASTTMQFRIVLHYGMVHLDSALSQGEDNIIGPEVNFVFRMEKVCGALNLFCLLSAAAAQHLKPFVQLSPQGAHALSGFEGQHAMYSC